MSTYHRMLCVVVLALTPITFAGAEEMKDMKHMDSSGTGEAQEQAQGVGVVKAVDIASGTVTIDHQPIKSFNWPGMNMMFKVSDPAILKNAAVGNKVEFTVQGKNMTKARITALKVIG